MHYSENEYIDWNCTTAIENIGFGSHNEIANYWEGVMPQEAKTWCENSSNNYAMKIEIETESGEKVVSWAHPDIFSWLEMAHDPPNIVRFL